MDKQELGAFLRSRRERLRPEDVGLASESPAPHTRAAPRGGRGPRAHLHGVLRPAGAGQRAPRPSGDVLAGIAGALRLTDAELDHLHVLAGTASSRVRLHRRDVRPSILALLERLPQTAGFVISASFEVLAWNDLAAALMEDFGRADAARPQPRAPGVPRATNTTTGRCTGSPTPRSSGITSSSDLRATARPLPRGSRRDRASSTNCATAAPSSPGSGSGTTSRPRRCSRKTFRHPVVGEVTVDCDSLALTDRDQHLVLYSAPPGLPGRRRARVPGRPGRANFLTSQRPTVVPRMSIRRAACHPTARSSRPARNPHASDVLRLHQHDRGHV